MPTFAPATALERARKRGKRERERERKAVTSKAAKRRDDEEASQGEGESVTLDGRIFKAEIDSEAKRFVLSFAFSN